ncbi:helix-turn-helix domain-containing protein [Sphingomonas sp. RIT328]|uniref:helix-turn-helix domain-containing protein n=1 Tax=Sphingomonas sp. RIT328 TaxID=1470591 RepID=UPI000452CA00|nr:helix-turn-helix domain-containing protein [Sphingomonas sp. RIT328]EZP51335.1 hypothetical protein BW41_02766 [Sphingomonas sp. RIT328]
MALAIADAVRTALDGMRPKQMRAQSGASHRTGAAVRRDSLEAGTFEDVFFAAPASGETDRLLRAARAALDAGRRISVAARAARRALTSSEALIARLKASTVRVFEELLTLARLNGGRVYPSYNYLAERTGLGRATVARAIRDLEATGFIAKQRRFERVEQDGIGPRYKQTSNAYRPLLPRHVLALLPRWMRPAPLPVDVEQHQAERGEEHAGMLATLSSKELAQAITAGPLGKALAALGAALDRGRGVPESESRIDPQPLKDSYIHGIIGVGLVGQRPNA